MGFFKKLFQGNQISEEEQRRRMGGRAPAAAEKPIHEMTEQEKISCWARAKELPDARERIRRLQELADAGFDTAWISLVDAYFDLSDQEGTDLPFEKIEYCAGKAADAGIPLGHTNLGMLYASSRYKEADTKRAVNEYLLAMEGGEESAARLLSDIWNMEFHHPEIPAEELRKTHWEIIREDLKEEMDRLEAEGGEKKLMAFGLLYYYGIYFEQDLNRARECFAELEQRGNTFGSYMLRNPVFADFDEDEDE